MSTTEPTSVDAVLGSLASLTDAPQAAPALGRSTANDALLWNGSILVQIEKAVATLTLKNIPTHLHALLKESAAKNRRSLNSEILTRLERDIAAPKVDRDKLARDLKAFTKQLPYVDHRIGDRYKRKGLTVSDRR